VAYADKTRVVLATPKTRAEQWPEFWGALQTTLQEEPEFTGIDFSDVAIRNLWYGLLWRDRADFISIPVGEDGEPVWKAQYEMEKAKALPGVVRTPLLSHAADWLMRPMKQLHRYMRNEPDMPALDALAKVSEWIRDEYLVTVRAKLFTLVEKVRERQTLELPLIQGGAPTGLPQHEEKRLHDLWDLPEVPGVIDPEESPSIALSFVKLLLDLLRLEDTPDILVAVRGLRRDLLKLLKEKEFDPCTEYKSGQHPVEVAVTCPSPFCSVVETIDVTTHGYSGPGLWLCRHCGGEYGKKYVEGLLVALVDDFVASWQAQDLHCAKCKQTKHDLVKGFCGCAGTYVTSLSRDEARRALLAIQSVAGPHGLPDLREVAEMWLDLV
jgi:DNA polymerase epsilon subunit 1